MAEKENPRLEVYLNRSILVDRDGDESIFLEGPPSLEARNRLEKIKAELRDGFLHHRIKKCALPGAVIPNLSDQHEAILHGLVSSVTSEVGRAIIGLTILQLAVKAIAPDQSVRLHKSGGGGANFSWKEGIPMRVLDKNFVTPVLRETGLLNLNSDGFMMTRSLAENYPYSQLYKAAIRGARREWLEIVEAVEDGELDPGEALDGLILLLINRSARFTKDAEQSLDQVEKAIAEINTIEQAKTFMSRFIEAAPYSARLFEISMHALFQALDEQKIFEGYVKPLSQMRSANKKHGNIGDIEIVSRIGGLQIVEAWDAKFGKSDLRDELEELNEKLLDHPETTEVGLVADKSPSVSQDLDTRRVELEVLHDTSIRILSFDEWVQHQVSRTANPDRVAKEWLRAFAESLCQRRRDVAPIDEPCDAWVLELGRFADNGRWKL